MIRNRYVYDFVIESKGEYDALAWASARWEGATVLYDTMHPPEDWDGETFPVTMSFQEHEMWVVKDAIEAEDAGFIPCLHENLNNRIQAMLDSVV